MGLQINTPYSGKVRCAYIDWHFQFIKKANQCCNSTSFYFKNKIVEGGFKLLDIFTENVPFWGCSIFCCISLVQSTEFCQWYFKCKRFMFLMKYFILFATVPTITERVSFFPFPKQPWLRRQVPSEYHQYQFSWLPIFYYHINYCYQTWSPGWWHTMRGSHT